MPSSHPYFGSNLKLLRARRGRSQEETAIGLDVKRSSWSGYENGSAEPPLDLLVRISNHFRVSVDRLLKDDLTSLSESQLGILERGGDVDLSGRRLRVLTTTVNNEDRENIELVNVKAKAGYALGLRRPGVHQRAAHLPDALPEPRPQVPHLPDQRRQHAARGRRLMGHR
jgi:transcriptional regulator with XRE-family HTH domain